VKASRPAAGSARSWRASMTRRSGSPVRAARPAGSIRLSTGASVTDVPAATGTYNGCMRHVSSPKNAEVRALLKLRERRTRDQEGVFLIEGRREIERAVQAGITIRTLYFCLEMSAPAGMRQLQQELELLGTDTVTLSPAAFTRLSLRENPDGALAVAETWQLRPEDLNLPKEPLLLVVDGAEKPGNLGALLRTADSAGADAVFLTGGGTDLFNPNVVRASMGSLFACPVTHVEADALVAWLRRRRFRIFATSPAAHQTYWNADLRGG